ncbi:MAG: hypothetical protein ACWA49_09595 [Ruegeria sp.]
MTRILPLSPASPAWLDGTLPDPATGPFVQAGQALSLRGTGAPDAQVAWLTSQSGQVGSGAVFTPGPELDRQELFVRVTLAGTRRQSPALPVRLPCPTAVFEPYPEIFDLGDGTEALPLRGCFAGDGLIFSSPDPIYIDPVTGIAEIPVTEPVSDGVITVFAANSGGRAELRLPYIVEEPYPRPVVFGGLSCPGHGGCEAPARALSDDGGTGLTLAGARLVPGSGLPKPGVMRFDDGSEWLVEVAANEYSVASGAEAARALKGAAPGSTVRLRAGARNVQLRLNGVHLTDVTLTADPGHSVERIELTDCSGITFEGLTIISDNSAGTGFKPTDAFYACAIRGSRDIAFRSCTFDCDPRQDGTMQSISSLMKRFGAIRANRSQIEVADCRIERVRDGIVANWGRAYIHGCHFRQIFEDAITGLHTHWQVDDNQATLFEGSSVRDLPGQISGNPVPGTLMRAPDGSNAVEVVRVQPGLLRARLNNYNLPRKGQRFEDGRGNSFVMTGRSKEARGMNIHGDFFQPILLKDSPGDCQVIARRNFVYRSLPYSRGTINQEPNTQGILAQRNGGPHYHAPCEITHNIIATGQPIGIKAMFCGDGIIANNTVIWAEMGIRSDLEIGRCRNLRVERNAGDNNSGGAVDDKKKHQNVIVAGNFHVPGRRGGQQQAYAAPFTYPQTLASFAPKPGSALDLSGAGALDSQGRWRR